MKFKFEANLEYQNEAISSIVDIFEGIKTKEGLFSLYENQHRLNFGDNNSIGFGNQITSQNWIEFIAQQNIEKIQLRNGLIESQIDVNFPTFDVEMETGTGKTYVFLKTILELSNKYDFKKFIIVVPSIAIKEGIKKTLQITKEHFQNLYPGLNYNWNEYDGSSLQIIWDFANNNNVEIMIMNIQAMNKIGNEEDKKTANVLYKNQDLLSGNRPIDLIKETNPIVIIDEPQSVSNGEKSMNAIKNLNPLFVLRYSATFKKRKKENLVYKLDAVDAYQKKLVKAIIVHPQELEYTNLNSYIKLINIDLEKQCAKIEIKKFHKEKGFSLQKVNVKVGDNLYLASNLEEYKEHIVDEIVFKENEEKIILTNGKEYFKGANDKKFDIHIKTAQIRQTIELHLDNQLKFLNKGIKVLSLFFIDKVKNYRQYDEYGNPVLGKYAKIFEQEFQKIITKKIEYLSLFDNKDIKSLSKQVHGGYFSIDNKNKFKDTSGDTKGDVTTYDKIMKDKEKLLSLDEKLCFIFSHSALKEGWDNPNVFQICTLNESKSEIKKRQEIGRGLRLCVDSTGQRIYDNNINKLNIITNNSFQDFAENLQKEYKEDGIYFGVLEMFTFSNEFNEINKNESIKIFNLLKEKNIITEKGKIDIDEYTESKVKTILKENTNLNENTINRINKLIGDSIKSSFPIKNGKSKKINNIKNNVFYSSEFQQLWNNIKKKTIYNISFDSDKFIKEVIQKVEQELSEIKQAQILSKKANIDISRTKGIFVKDATINSYTEIDENNFNIQIPDLVSDIEKITNLTRKTIVRILTSTKIIEFIKKNHEELKKIIIQKMIETKEEMMVHGIEYKKLDNMYYEQDILKENEKEIFFDESRFIETHKDDNKYPFQYIEFDSNIEFKFAHELLNSKMIHKFIKLPREFKIKTPLGTYNPDWALYANEEVIFIAETKGSNKNEDLRLKESMKIYCGKKHFEAIDIRFYKTTSLADLISKIRKDKEKNE